MSIIDIILILSFLIIKLEKIDSQSNYSVYGVLLAIMLGAKLTKKNGFQQIGKLLQEGLSSTEISTSSKFNFKPTLKKNKASTDSAFDFLALIQAWPEIIGSGMAKHTIPLKNTRRSLTILTDHPAYSEQLKFMEIQLLGKIKVRFPNLRDSLRTLYFKTDSTFFRKQKSLADQRTGTSPDQEIKIEKTFHKYSPEYRKLKAIADEEFKDLEDDDVKEKLISIFIQSRQAK